jgi:hypothetical protein
MTTLPDDYARCEGIRSIGTCHNCLRKKQYDLDRKRTDIFRITYLVPPKAAYENKCGFFIEDKESE